MANIVKITQGQPFVIYVPLVILNADGSKEAVQADTLTDVQVQIHGAGSKTTLTPDTYEHYLVLNIPATLAVAEYDILITATLHSGRAFSLRMSHAFGVMAWDWQTNWRDYLVGEHIELCDQPFIAGEFTTDAEYEELKRELREAIAEAEQAKKEAIAEKEHYAEAVEQLGDLALQGDNPNATNTQILYDVNHLVVPPPTGMALESTLTAGITALQNAITALYGGDLTATLSALKTAIANISIDTSDLAKANALAAVQSDIDALQVLVGTTADTSTDATIFGKFAAVLAAVAGITGYATPTDVANAQAAIIAAMPSVSGLATETNATSNKQAILDAIAAISTLIGAPAVGQPSTLFAAIAAGGGGGGGGGDAQESTSQAILAAVKNNDTTTLAELLNSTYGLAAIQSLLNGIVNTYPYAKEATAQQILSNTGNLGAITSELNSGKQLIASAINTMGGSSQVTDTLAEMAQEIEDLPILSGGGLVWASGTQLESQYDILVKFYSNIEKYTDSSTVVLNGYFATFYNYSTFSSLKEVTFSALTSFAANGSRSQSGTSAITYFFSGLQSLEKVTMDHIESFSVVAGSSNTMGAEMDAFSGCINLRQASFASLESIASSSSGSTSPSTVTFLYGCTALTSVNMPNLKSITITTGIGSVSPANNNFMAGCSLLQSVSLPMLTSVNTYRSGGSSALNVSMFNGCSSLESVSIATQAGNIDAQFGTGTVFTAFGSCPNLIDITFGQVADGVPTINADILLFIGWNPSNVLADQSKVATMNANIRNHIVSNLRDRSGIGTRTFYFNTNMQSYLEQATLDAFAAKGWTVAYRTT